MAKNAAQLQHAVLQQNVEVAALVSMHSRPCRWKPGIADHAGLQENPSIRVFRKVAATLKPHCVSRMAPPTTSMTST